MMNISQIKSKDSSGIKLVAAFFTLIRYPNLLFILLTQFLLQYAVILPVFQQYGVAPSLTLGWFFLLSLSTILIAAAGNIINDYYDIPIDRVNKPEKIIIGKSVRKHRAWEWFIGFNVLGLGLGFLVAWHVGYLLLGFTQLCCSGLLWFYSTAYKRQLLIGNIVVSLLTALTVLVVGFYEPILYREITSYNAAAVFILLRVILLYGAFAFLISMIRELIKDIEDMKGDRRQNCRTLPIVYGTSVSKVFVFGLIGILVILIFFVQYRLMKFAWYFSVLYLFAAVQVPLVWMGFKLRRATKPKEYHRLSTIVKLIMLTGILSMLFIING